MFRKSALVVISAVYVLLGGLSAGWADAPKPEGPKNSPVDLTSYDPKSLVFVTNRDSNDVAVIDSKTDTVISRISLGTFANAHMAMLTNNGKKLLVSATGRDRFL